MGKISDALREWVSRARADEHMSLRELDNIADRIDREMVELPRDRDGAPIHVGDTVWDMRNWKKLSVIDIVMGAHEVRLYVTPDETVEWYINPTDLTHNCPDSFERIADELEEWREDNRVNGDSEIFDRAADFADRIRKLAKKEGEQCQ